jgi:DNA ligase-1
MGTASFVNVLHQCESAGGAGSKEVIKAALKTLDADGQNLFKCAMDPFLVFGVKKYDLPISFAAKDPEIKQFKDLLDKLSARELTGNAARDAVTNTLAQYTEQTAKYFARVIDKDLQAGFSPETYNKIFKDSTVRVFDVMLADKCEDADAFEKRITFPCQADVKYDGERNIAFYCAEETNFAPKGASYRSRSGKIAAHMAGLFDEDLAKIRDYLGYDFVLDGERMAKDYIETINAKKTGEEGEAGKKNMRFRAFFLMPLNEWTSQVTPITMKQNRAALEKILEACKCEKIILSEGREVQNYEDMIAYCDEVTTPGFDNQVKGQEGLILKDWNSVYEWDRSMAWCKVKKFYDADCKIINWEFGKKQNANVMGRVNVVGFLEDGTRVECGVGSGWSKLQRQDVADNFEQNWKDKVIVVKYQEVSKGKDKAVHSLRFPTTNGIVRDDKTFEID